MKAAFRTHYSNRKYIKSSSFSDGRISKKIS